MHGLALVTSCGTLMSHDCLRMVLWCLIRQAAGVQVDVVFERDEDALDQALDQIMDEYGNPIILEHGPVDGLEVSPVLSCQRTSESLCFDACITSFHTAHQGIVAWLL